MFKRLWKRRRKEKRSFNIIGQFFGYLKLNEDDDYDEFELDVSELAASRRAPEFAERRQKRSKNTNFYDFSECKLLPIFRLEQLLEKRNKKFSETLLEFIDASGQTDAEVYKKAGIDRKHFSKIRKNPDHMPKKSTVIAFAIALELSVIETEALLESAGYSLSNSYEFDIIIRFFLQRKIYNRYTINEILEEYHLEPL